MRGGESGTWVHWGRGQGDVPGKGPIELADVEH